MNVHIRPFTDGDQTVIQKLILEGLGEHFGYIDQSLNPDLDDIQTNYLMAGHLFVVAEKDTNLVGAGALIMEPSSTGRLTRISVAHNYRGQGIGETIVNHLIETGRRLGLHQILVETNLDWYPAIKLYKKLGFSEVCRDTESIYFSLRL